MIERFPPGTLLLRVALHPWERLGGFGAPETADAMRKAAESERALRDRERAVSDALYRLAGPRPDSDLDPAAWARRNAILALRRDVYNRRPLSFGRAGTPLPLPDDLAGDVAGIVRAREELDRSRRGGASSYYARVEAERRLVVEATRDPVFGEAAWLANRSLHGAVGKLEKRDPSGWRNEETHAAIKLLAYLARGATKTSPNSLFCATACAGAGEDYRIEGEGGIASAITRLNVFEARKVASCLAAAPELRPRLRPRPNPTLRRLGDGWSCWRPPTLREDGEDEIRVEIGANAVLDRILELTAAGERTWPGLVDSVAESTGFDPVDLERFLETVVEKGVLIAEAEVPFNEPRPLAALAAKTGDQDPPPPWSGALREIEESVDALPPPGAPDRIPGMIRIGERLAALPHVRPLSEDDLFRVDAASGFRVTLPREALAEIAEATDHYVRLFNAFYPRPSRSPFAAAFLQRFPPDRDVPLLDLYHRLEEPGGEFSLGSFPVSHAEERGKGTLPRFQDRLIEGANRGESEVALSPGDLEEYLLPGAPPRWMAGVLFQIVPLAGESPARPGTRFVLNAIYPGAGLALARFHELHRIAGEGGDSIARVVRSGWESLVPEGALGAEITYTHWGRTANAGLRPAVFRHEIELSGSAATPGAEVIPLADLVVHYETARERFRLRSVTRGVEVVPFLSSGVRPEGFVNFLVHVGTQDLAQAAFFPGFDRKGIVRWPRVAVGRVVLFRERWVFGEEDGPAAYAAKGTAGPAWFEGIQRWRERHRIPRRVFASSAAGGKPFYLDLESPLFTEMFRRALAGGDPGMAERTVITEMLPAPENLWIHDRKGAYASEFLFQTSGPSMLGKGDDRLR